MRLLALVLAIGLVPRVASADVITAEAFGSVTPATVVDPGVVTNGDFTIEANSDSPGSVVGDGINEQTSWIFDFTKDPNFATFDPSVPLASAILTLTLTPHDPMVTTDAVGLGNLPFIVTPTIQGLTLDVTQTVTIDLLQFYTSAQVLAALFDNGGTPPAFYGDDAIVSYAKLELRPVPEPGSAALAVIGSP